MMERSIFNRKMFFALLTIFVFVFAIQMVEPTSAAKVKLFSKGQKTYYSNAYNEYYVYSWKSYKKTNYVLIKDREYWKSDNTLKGYGKYVLKKVNKKKLKIIDTWKGKTKVYYIKTKLSAYQYYKKHFNKNGVPGLS